MPLYEFDCEACGRTAELLVRSTNWKGSTCPHCGSKKLQKKFSVFASSASSGEAAGGASPTACATPPRGGCCGGGPHCH